MRFLNLARQYSPASTERDILGHWIWAIPVILIVAALAFRRVDYFPPSHDEFRSLTNSGWIFNRPYSPVEVLQSLARVSPIQTPFYFILLNAWGSFGRLRCRAWSNADDLHCTAFAGNDVPVGARYGRAGRRALCGGDSRQQCILQLLCSARTHVPLTGSDLYVCPLALFAHHAPAECGEKDRLLCTFRLPVLYSPTRMPSARFFSLLSASITSFSPLRIGGGYGCQLRPP